MPAEISTEEINEIKKNRFLNGLSISNSNLVGEGKKFIDFNIDDKGSIWTTLITGLSNSFNFEIAYGNSSESSKVENKYAKAFVKPKPIPRLAPVIKIVFLLSINYILVFFKKN